MSFRIRTDTSTYLIGEVEMMELEEAEVVQELLDHKALQEQQVLVQQDLKGILE